MNETHTATFEAERSRLTSIAYRMLGERAAAEDVVQDAWLRWAGADVASIRSPAAWLTTTTTRLAIDALTSARTRREVYIGPWLPEAEITPWETSDAPDAALEKSQNVSLALMWAMERLAPEERAAFLLREVFDTDYADIAETLGRNEAACRQIVSRAKKRVAERTPRFDAPPDEVSDLLGRFMTATASLDRAEVISLLAPDVVVISDGGGKARAALRPLEGPEEVARVWLSLAEKRLGVVQPKWVMANGQPALAILEGSETDMMVTLVPDEAGLVRWVYVLRNPDKLAASCRGLA